MLYDGDVQIRLCWAQGMLCALARLEIAMVRVCSVCNGGSLHVHFIVVVVAGCA